MFYNVVIVFRLQVAAAVLRKFDNMYGGSPGGGSGYRGSGGDPYARPPPEYYSEKGDMGGMK